MGIYYSLKQKIQRVFTRWWLNRLLSRRTSRFTHGLWMGSSWMDGFTLDISDPDVIKEIAYLDELVAELQCGDEVGYGMLEVVVVGKYPRYGYEDF